MTRPSNNMKVLVLLTTMMSMLVTVAFSPGVMTMTSGRMINVRVVARKTTLFSSTNSVVTKMRPNSENHHNTLYTSVRQSYRPVSWATTRHLGPRCHRGSSFGNTNKLWASTAAATSGAGDESLPSNNEENNNNDNRLQEIWSTFLDLIQKYVWNPVRTYLKLLAKTITNVLTKIRKKYASSSSGASTDHKSLAKDVQKLYKRTSSEPLVVEEESVETNGQVLSSSVTTSVDTSSSASSPMITVAEEKVVVVQTDKEESAAATEPEVKTATATLAPPEETTIEKEDDAASLEEASRWAVSAPKVSLSGNWTMMISEDFKKQYDEYLKQLGQPLLVRSVALSIVGMTTEETIQKNDGRELLIRGRNARGIWERTLITSLSKDTKVFLEPHVKEIVTADNEIVKAEAWWEKEGTVHKSWLKGGTKWGGGDFESSRYLEQDPTDGGVVLVCESVFHPNDKTRDQARVTWRFKRR